VVVIWYKLRKGKETGEWIMSHTNNQSTTRELRAALLARDINPNAKRDRKNWVRVGGLLLSKRTQIASVVIVHATSSRLNSRRCKVIYNQNQTITEVKRNGAGTETWGPNFWMKTGHCRRCENGLGHVMCRRGAGGEHPSGVILQRFGKHVYEDEIAPGEKPGLRRRQRHQEKTAIRRLVREEFA
jgi:hypothetical protein